MYRIKKALEGDNSAGWGGNSSFEVQPPLQTLLCHPKLLCLYARTSFNQNRSESSLECDTETLTMSENLARGCFWFQVSVGVTYWIMMGAFFCSLFLAAFKVSHAIRYLSYRTQSAAQNEMQQLGGPRHGRGWLGSTWFGIGSALLFHKFWPANLF